MAIQRPRFACPAREASSLSWSFVKGKRMIVEAHE
jgi:hypothetical protein